MSLSPASPLVVVAVTNNGGKYEIQTSGAHGASGGASVSIGGCRNASGALIAGLNGSNLSAVASDSTHFTLTASTYAAGYAQGGAVWIHGTKVTAATLTAFDSLLATRAADVTGDALFGVYGVAGTGAFPVTGGGQVLTEEAGAAVGPTSTGSLILGDGDDVELLPPRPRSIMVSPLEAMNEYTSQETAAGITLSVLGPTICAMQNYVPSVTTGVQNFWIPLTRLHDKATLVAATLLFFPTLLSQPGLILPTVFPTLQLFRLNPSTDTQCTSLAETGPAIFPTASSVSSYTTTAAIGASGDFTLATLNGGSAAINAGGALTDPDGNTFQVTASGTYENGAPVPVKAQAPAAPAVFLGANTNDAAGTVLTWTTAPANCQPTQLVAADLEGGLNAGYAQSLVFTPDSDLATIALDDFVYFLKFTTDNATVVNTNGYAATQFSGIRLDFANIVSLTPQ